MSLVCQATGQPTPTVTRKKLYGNVMKNRFKNDNLKMTILNVTKEDGGGNVCSAKNMLNKDSVVAQVMFLEELKFRLLPPKKLVTSTSSLVILNSVVQGATEISWKLLAKPKSSSKPHSLFKRNFSSQEHHFKRCGNLLNCSEKFPSFY